MAVSLAGKLELKDFLGSRDSFLWRCLRKKEVSGKIFWIDFMSADKNIWEIANFNPAAYNEIICVIPPLAVQKVDWVFIYEKLSMLIELQKQYRFAICYLSLTGESEQDRKQQILLAKYGAEYAETAGENGPSSGVYLFSAEVSLWIPKRIRMRYASKIAKEFLTKAWKLEERFPDEYVPENIRPWWDNMQEAFYDKANRLGKEFGEAFSNTSFGVDRAEFVERFGTGRPRFRGQSRFDRLIRLLAPDNKALLRKQNVDEQPDLFFLFSPAIRPFVALEEVLAGLEKMQPLFYRFPAVNINKIKQVEWEMPDASEFAVAENRLQNIPLWSANPEISARIQELGRLTQAVDQLRTARGATRSNLQQQFIQDLEAFRNNFHEIVNSEVQTILMDHDILLRFPATIFAAYTEFWRQFMSPFLEMYQRAWWCRRFVFQLPAWLPAPFFSRSPLIITLADILIDAIRLLDLYQFTAQSLMFYRESMKRSYCSIDRIKGKLPCLEDQIEHIFVELEETSFMDRHFDWSQLTDDKITVVSEEYYLNPERLVEETMEQATALIKKAVSQIASQAKKTRTNCKQIEQSPFTVFTPAHFQKNEAWVMADDMAKTILRHPDFDLLDLEGKKDVYQVIYDKEKIDILQDQGWRTWKKRALKETDKRLEYDAIVYSIPNIESKKLVEWLVNTGELKGFLEQGREGRIGIPEQVFKWLSPESRRFFFQRRRGLTKTELVKKCDPYILQELHSWVMWIMKKIDPEMDVDDIFSCKAGELFDLISNESNLRGQEVNHFDHIYAHRYFGKPYLLTPYFMLVDCMSPVLMRLFAPAPGNAAPRYFSRDYFKNYLKEQENQELLYELTAVFFDYCMYTDQAFPILQNKVLSAED